MRTVYKRPEFRGNLFLGLLLGVHLVISLPRSSDCAYAQEHPPASIAVQHNNAC